MLLSLWQLLSLLWPAMVVSASPAPDGNHAADPLNYRAILARAALSEDAAVQLDLVQQLAGTGDALVVRALAAWRVGELYIYRPAENAAGEAVLLDGQADNAGRQAALRVSDGQTLANASGEPIRLVAGEMSAVDTTSKLRRAIKTALDLHAISNPDPKVRADAITKLGQQQNAEYVPYFEKRAQMEENKTVKKALDEAIALTRCADADPAVQTEAVRELGRMRSINALDFLKDLQQRINKAESPQPDLAKAVGSAIYAIENHIWWGNLFGTGFRGLSLAAVLLVAALGLAITFGLMGVINMAHGEIMAVGAYTAYIVQGLFGTGLAFSLLGRQVMIPGRGFTGAGFDSYFVVALVASFFTAALVGLVLERGVIRFLYKRPLESLLATWGVSLVLQQIFRHTFGAANVQVSSPSWLSGSFVIRDVLLAYNRLFVIGFAIAIVAGCYLLLTRTSLGLQIRAVMQNRNMASCMGVRTDRVNMMTFMLGSGLAGMAGACMSQIANVGPSLGQNYIIDCFMVVVLGGVGNLVGTVSASLGIGVTDQLLQPWLGAVLGKITVLAAIILFLQWRPAGMFVTRSRSLDG